jgi:hypothetical protein
MLTERNRDELFEGGQGLIMLGLVRYFSYFGFFLELWETSEGI